MVRSPLPGSVKKMNVRFLLDHEEENDNHSKEREQNVQMFRWVNGL